MIIPELTLSALAQATADGQKIILPGISDQETYRDACRVLKAAGGQRINGGYKFSEDAGIILNDLIVTGQVFTPADTGFFPTPSPVTRRLLSAVGDLAGKRVLEPSAGLGTLAVAAAQAGAVVDCIEVHPPFARQLEALSMFNSVRCADFLSLSPGQAYDAVIMNPPFNRGRETTHLLYAWLWVKPGGVLAAVLPDMITTRGDRRTKQLRTLISVFGGEVTPLPAGSFADSGTQWSTVTLIMRRPAGEPLTPATGPAPGPDAYTADGLFPVPARQARREP